MDSLGGYVTWVACGRREGTNRCFGLTRRLGIKATSKPSFLKHPMGW
jgi:hypothetical protein